MTLQVSCLHDSIQKKARLTDHRGLPHISAALCFWSNNLNASTCTSMLSLILCSWWCKGGAAGQELRKGAREGEQKGGKKKNGQRGREK